MLNPQKRNGIVSFEGTNYLLEDFAFKNVQLMAKSGKIEIIPLDLNNAVELSNAINLLKSRDVTVSVLDISNAWWNMYLNRDAMLRTLDEFKKISLAESRLVLTSRAGADYPTHWDKSGHWLWYVLKFGDPLLQKSSAQFIDHYLSRRSRFVNATAINGKPFIEAGRACVRALYRLGNLVYGN